MANFRCERLYVMLDEPVPGMDHLKAVDPVEFSYHDSDTDAEDLNLTALGDCTFAPWERPRWRPTAVGLRTVRGLITLYRERIAQDRPEFEIRNKSLAKKIAVLAQVEAVLNAADTRDRKFYLAAKDLA